MKARTTSVLFAHSRLDAIPVLAGIAQLAFLLALYFGFRRLPWWVLLPAGFVYAVGISWNINGISHNFLHNPYFRWPPLNRAFSLLESVTLGFSQVFYEQVHKEHHMGNADLPDEHGETIDPLSIFKHGRGGKPENVWSYSLCSYFRDDPKEIYRAIRARDARAASWGIAEIVSFVAVWLAAFAFNWRFALWFLPFYYLGHCLSYLNGYYLHYGANPHSPIAWGVSSYHTLYNWLWFNNGYHAEHHYRPKLHWTRMKQLHEKIRTQQESAHVRVIQPPHALGFLDRHLPRFRDYPSQTPAAKGSGPRESPAAV